MVKGKKKNQVVVLTPAKVDKKLLELIEPLGIPKGATEREKVILIALIEAYGGVTPIELIFLLIKKYLSQLPTKERRAIDRIIKKISKAPEHLAFGKDKYLMH